MIKQPELPLTLQRLSSLRYMKAGKEQSLVYAMRNQLTKTAPKTKSLRKKCIVTTH